MDRIKKASDLEQIDIMVEESASKAESPLHKAMKKWIAIESYEKGTPISDFEFEKKIRYSDEIGRMTRHTTIDVFIDDKEDNGRL